MALNCNQNASEVQKTCSLVMQINLSALLYILNIINQTVPFSYKTFLHTAFLRHLYCLFFSHSLVSITEIRPTAPHFHFPDDVPKIAADLKMQEKL